MYKTGLVHTRQLQEVNSFHGNSSSLRIVKRETWQQMLIDGCGFEELTTWTVVDSVVSSFSPCIWCTIWTRRENESILWRKLIPEISQRYQLIQVSLLSFSWTVWKISFCSFRVLLLTKMIKVFLIVRGIPFNTSNIHRNYCTSYKLVFVPTDKLTAGTCHVTVITFFICSSCGFF